MTTIRPLTGGINLEVRHIGSDGHALINVGPLPKPVAGGYTSEQSARYPVADILAALDATANADVKHHADAYRAASEAEAKLTEQYRRADKAEAEVARMKDAFDDRVKSLQAAWDELDNLRAERDALAATVEWVREATAIWGDSQFRAAVLAALDPKPAFVLPTEAGARFYGDHNGYQTEFTTYSNGSDALYVSDDGDIWTPLQMDKVTDLRGAE